ncbi:MAG: tRNA pseudouridine synthase A [Treponematales bacterium]
MAQKGAAFYSGGVEDTRGERNIGLLLAYDGTDFSGWARQGGSPPPASGDAPPPPAAGARREGVRTVQGEIETALERLHQRPVALTGSGRTDAGVHAAGQRANFRTGLRMDAARFVPALNGFLPRDIRVLAAWDAAPDFHSRFDARARTYRYHLVCGRPALPWELRYAWSLRRRPSLAALNNCARLLSGELDCTAFAVPGDKSLSRSRCFYGASFFVERDTLVFEITANAFLWKMARSITGTLLRFEEAGLPPEAFRELLASGDRTRAGPTAPPQGLFLWHIAYYKE